MKKVTFYLVTYFCIAGVFSALADKKVDAGASDDKKLDDVKLESRDLASKETSHEIQRRRDPGYFYNKQHRFYFGATHGLGRPGYRGRIVTKLQNQINRPFKQYGLPNQENSFNEGYNHSPGPDNLVNQEAPIPMKYTEFVEESPIASQNSQPFGQHTANYLPPRNQKLPSTSPSYVFSNQNHDFPNHHQQQQQQDQQQQQFQQLQIKNQNFPQQDLNVNVQNQNFDQNDFNNQQISDAALFLSQNAQAISDLYGAPAPDQNYAPNNQPDQQQHVQQNVNLQVDGNSQFERFQQQQFPSYSSGILNANENLGQDRYIAQLQQALNARETSARYTQNENLLSTSATSHAQGSHFYPSTTPSSAGYQGFYGPSTPAAPTTAPPIPVPSTPPTTATNLQPAQGSSGAGTSQVGTSLPAPGALKPPIIATGFPQYGGFVPSFVSTSSFIPSIPSIPSIPTYGTTLFPATSLKPVESAPTHFGIPIPTLPTVKPVNPPLTIVPAPTKPPTVAHPSTPTFSIPLGPVLTPVQPAVVKPNPVIPAATPVHPTYGIHPAIASPGFIYKPVKVVPFYYYPNVAYQTINKQLGGVASTHPWSYAPTYSQVKPGVWK